jgi:hypothetical protein
MASKYWCNHCNEEPLTLIKNKCCSKCGNEVVNLNLDESFYYLASPYSHPDIRVLESRYRAALAAVNYLMKKGIVVFSPIVHNHMIAMNYGLPTGWSYWAKYDEIYLKASAGLIILELDGWKESIGIDAEITIAKGLNKKIKMLSYSEVLKNE